MLRPALTATKGYAAAEAGETIARARALAEQIDRSFEAITLVQSGLIERMDRLGYLSADKLWGPIASSEAHLMLKDAISGLPHIETECDMTYRDYPPTDDLTIDDEIGTIKDACRVIGGTKPVSLPTYYRGVKAGIFPAPFHPSPGISRVNLRELRERILSRARAE